MRLLARACVLVGIWCLAGAAYAQQTGGLRVAKAREISAADSLKAKEDSLARVARKTSLDSLARQSSLSAPMKYKAQDSLVLDLEGAQLMRLYGRSKLDQENRKLDAERISVNIDSSIIRAEGVPDSTGENFTGEPIMNEGGQKFEVHRMAYNFKSKKGVLNYTRTQQGESYVIASRSKRVPDGSFYNEDNKFTTCSNPNPHFHLHANRIKFLPNNRVVTGPFYMAFADIPIPLIVPFGFFPSSAKRSSGVIFPAFGEDANRGFNLRNGGYYFVLSDHWDASIVGDIYARGSYRAAALFNYNKRYAYQGTFNYQYANNRFGTEGDPDFNQTFNWFINWSHQQKLSPTAVLSASVNAGASGFLRQNSFQISSVLTNTLNSSIAFSKTFPRSGWSLAVTANMNQDISNKIVGLSAPNINLSKTNRIYPFRWKELTGTPTWYENIGISYNASFTNSVSVAERNFGKKAMFDSLRYGLVQTSSMNTNLTVLRFLTLTPSLNYTEWWYGKTTDYGRFSTYFDPNNLINPKEVGDTIVVRDPFSGLESVILKRRVNGFQSARDFNLSLNLSTRLYGLKQFSGPKRMALRHVLIPSASYTYRPDFSNLSWGYYRHFRVDPENTRSQRFSRFVDNVSGGPGAGLQSSVNFRLQNTLELKYLSRKEREKIDDSKPQFTYLKLLDDLSLGASYNFAADSFRLSQIPITARTSIFKNKINIQGTANLDPYAFNAAGNRTREYEYNVSGKLGTITSASLAIGLNLAPGNTDAEQAKKAKALADGEAGQGARVKSAAGAAEAPDELTALERFRRLYVDFDVPWTLGVNYNWSYSYNRAAGRSVVQTLSLNASVNLTQYWRIQMFSGYDFQAKGVSITSFSIMRDLHCWELSFTATPFGTFRSYFLQVYVKAQMLQDLKLQKRRDWQDFILGPVR